MKRKDKKEKSRDKKEKYIIQVRGEAQDLFANFDMEMKMARNQPKIYYSKEGQIKDVK